MQFRGVKGYVLVVLLMLVPSTMYFQKLAFLGEPSQKLKARVIRALVESNVESPRVTMDWMDARIEGRVKSVRRRAEIGQMVDSLPGVRLKGEANRLRADGWVKLAREGALVKATGLLPPEPDPRSGEASPKQTITLDPDLGRLFSDWDESDYVMLPDVVLEWKEFLETYFAEVGDRAVELRDGDLFLTGSATPGLKSDWLSKASSVVGRENVDERFELYPSVYHLPGYVQRSNLPADVRAQITARLKRSTIFFEPEKSEIRSQETTKISSLATAMLAMGGEEQYVIGIVSTKGPGSPAERNLWADRVAAVMRLLIDYGLRYEQLEVVDFSPLHNGGRDNGVEILLK